MGGVYELPNDLFSIIDDNINEMKQSFAVVAQAEVGANDGINFAFQQIALM